jgi:hypothetical protein
LLPHFTLPFNLTIKLRNDVYRLYREAPNGLRYLRWGGDGEAVKTELAHSVDKA